MNTIKIHKQKSEFIFEGTYHGVDRTFTFNTQTSEKPHTYTLTKGSIIEIDVESSKNRSEVKVNGVYHMEGVFYNFYKRYPDVLMTFCTNIIDVI